MPQRPGATDGPGPLSALEDAVLAAMLEGPGPDLATLRTQLSRAAVASRTHSGVGFVTRLTVPDDVPVLPGSASHPLKPLHATHPELQEAAEFLVQLRGGRLAVLEAYCFQGPWPSDATAFRLPA